VNTPVNYSYTPHSERPRPPQAAPAYVSPIYQDPYDSYRISRSPLAIKEEAATIAKLKQKLDRKTKKIMGLDEENMRKDKTIEDLLISLHKSEDLIKQLVVQDQETRKSHQFETDDLNRKIREVIELYFGDNSRRYMKSIVRR
jgi:hypothetical protein